VGRTDAEPEELEKRIGELRTVQFWLEQNAKMLAATIQALEVQRMTLSTLKTMNVQMEDLRDSLQIRMPGRPRAAPAPTPRARPRAPKRRRRGRRGRRRRCGHGERRMPHPPRRRRTSRARRREGGERSRAAAWSTRCSGGAR
jgi:hypothetical protein